VRIIEYTDFGFTIENKAFIISHDESKDKNVFLISTKSLTQEFYIPSSCDTTDGLDINDDISSFELFENTDCIEITWFCTSSMWRKEYKLIVRDEAIEYYYILYGNRFIDTLRYFEGIPKNKLRKIPSTKHFNDKKNIHYRVFSKASKVNFSKVFNPEPNTYDKQYFNFFDYSLISAHSDIDYCGGNYIFNPSMFMFGIANEITDEWVSLGLAVKPNEYNFSEYEYLGGKSFGLNLNYWGVFQTIEKYETPRILILSEKTEFGCVAKYVKTLETYGYIDVDCAKKDIPKWWLGPIICGWGHQCYMADLFRARSPYDRNKDLAAYYMCTQGNYEKFVEYINARTNNWKILCIDARWTLSAGEKTLDTGRWPNLRGFVDKLHSEGKKVVLWWGMWETEGLDDSLCINYNPKQFKAKENREGRLQKFGDFSSYTKLTPDPTLDEFKSKIVSNITKLFGSGKDCFDIDGIKIDHVAAAPGLYGLEFPKGTKGIFGVELIKYYQKFIYDEIKRIKKDALIIGQSVNPYFRDCTDMIRLGDIYSGTFSIVDQMKFRVKLAQISNPSALIDMDNWPVPSLESFKDYMHYQVTAGVPSLYYSSHIDTTNELITDEIYEQINMLWGTYINRHY